MQWYPLIFQPILKPRIWGGQSLQKYFGKPLPKGEKIGESWELADLPQDKSIIANGSLASRTLREVIDHDSASITGHSMFPEPFPLLIKLLDAHDILSVQVHPDRETCQRLGSGDPKTECWYIIHAEPGAFIYKGLHPGVTREGFQQAVHNGTVEDLLQKVFVQAGECHFLPAGTIHSIGPGLLIAEIQRPSDTTYRVFDFNRVSTDGRPRQLHIQEALESIHFDQSPESLPVTRIGRLVDCEFFIIDKGHQVASQEVLLSRGRMHALIFLSGAGVFISEGCEPVPFKAGDCVLIPWAYEGVMRCDQEIQYLRVTL